MEHEIHSFFDETGSRLPLHDTANKRYDGLDCFGLGGILIDQEKIGEVREYHQVFCDKSEITYPLHSHGIRGCRGNFTWLDNPEQKGRIPSRS